MTDTFNEMLSRHTDGNALRETMQQVALAGLWRGGFFNKAAFYGGTCLRLFHGADRFSEDMDFSLLAPDATFALENYFDAILAEFKALGRGVTISKKEKTKTTNIESAFLKDDTAVYSLHFREEKKVKIKIEVDINPPPGFATEQKLSLLPFSFMTRCYVLSDLYAGKMHALLFRTWRERVKGRDWYDWEWYVRKNIPLNFNHFRQRTLQFKSWRGTSNDTELTREVFFNLLRERIAQTDFTAAKNDVLPFIANPVVLDIWSKDYFLQIMEKMKFV
jgi:predicted nucleotidyltransferase component of viral defense system